MRAALLVVVALVACNAARGPEWKAHGRTAPVRGGTLRFALPSNISTLDPAFANDDISVAAIHALFDTLLDYAPDGYALVPRLAEALPEITDAGKTYTFRLRADLAYSDGTPCVAGDAKYALDRTKALPDAPFSPLLANVAAVEAPDSRTLVVRLTEPDVAFAYVMTMPFTTPQRAAHVADAGEAMRQTPLGTGPYALAAWSEGERLELVRNPHAHADPARGFLDRIVLLENVAADAQFLMFAQGELDAIDHLAAPDLVWIESVPAWKPYIHERALPVAFGSRMDTQAAPFRDRRVRQALNYAVDKTHAVKLLHGTAVAAHGVLPPGLPGRDDTIAPYPHDPVKARALLAAAGYPNGFTVPYVIPIDDEAETIAASLQGDLAEVGVTLKIERVTLATYVDAIGKPTETPFSLVGWAADYPDPSAFFDLKFHSRAIGEGGGNDTRYANPELDALLDRAKHEVDTAARAALYRRAERIVYDDAPWIFGYHQLAVQVVQPYVKDAEPHPIWTRDFTRAWLDVGDDGARERAP